MQAATRACLPAVAPLAAAGLYFFGQDVGRLFGGKRLLGLYLLGGLAGSLAHCGW